ncbi:MAG TPA: GAF domain-containing sensor histidine kinase [Burkholderiales bacterium]|nr:GAF domain-containing sensor histidine kinase [Burkholderiales bacterium]
MTQSDKTPSGSGTEALATLSEADDTDELAADVATIARIEAIPQILEVVCRITGMGFAAVARVTDQRWIACAVRDEIAFGLQPGGELKVETTICSEIRDHGRAVVIDNVAEDDVYCGHPTPALYGFQSYISVPIFRPTGEFFGTLCAIDQRPARLNTPETIGMFKLFAGLIAFHLEAQDRVAASEAALLDERKTAELREQFIAVLGHDLRNPLASIDAGAQVLRRVPLDPRGVAVVDLIHKSVRRMAGLIDDVMDFARARLGGGMVSDRTAADPLGPTLEQVIAELRTAWPERTIDARITLSQPIYCDRARIAQLLSNLLANALTHGDPNGPVAIAASCTAGVFELSVANRGEPIPPATIEHLFHPFSRASLRPNQQGLGLGLYIAAEIARAHGGTLDVTSTPVETCFKLRMPANA